MRINRRQLLLALGGLVAAGGGFGAYKVLGRLNRAPAEFAGPQGTIADLDTTEPFDVCIIGSGPAGIALGIDLAKKGLRTVVLESGANLGEMGDPRFRELDVFESTGEEDYPLSGSRIRALGGTSNVWTGRCSRFHPGDFEHNAYTPAGADWPVTYAELEPWYARAEQTLRVRGGELSSYHAPRSGALPLPADVDISGLKELLAGGGVTVDDSPSSTSQTGAGPLRVADSLLPEYAAQPGAALVAHVTVTQLVTDDSGRVTGAEVQNLDRTRKLVRARSYVVACGAVASARLLLLSRAAGHPSGLGNDFDQVGRCFGEHPNILFSGMIEHTWNTLSPQYELGRSHQFYDEFKQQGLGSVLLSFIQSWVFREDLSGWSAEKLARKARELAGRLSRAKLRIGVTLEMEPAPSNRIALAADLKDYFGNPAPDVALTFSERDRATMAASRAAVSDIYRRLGASEVSEIGTSWSHHHIGTCRMGNDPRTSVVNADLRVHGTPNLYVVGSGNFVTGGAAHPTLLITALAHRLAAHLNTRLREGELAA